jgi:hypothetical protein
MIYTQIKYTVVSLMAKRKDRQYNSQKKGQTMQWPKERTDNTTAKIKDRQYNGQKKGQTIQ